MRLTFEALKSFVKRPFTQKYPRAKPEVPEKLRGKHIFYKEKCIFCGLCAKYCPSQCITVDRENKKYSIDLGKCTFCAQCQEVCHIMPKRDAIVLGREYEIAGANKKDFVLKW